MLVISRPEKLFLLTFLTLSVILTAFLYYQKTIPTLETQTLSLDFEEDRPLININSATKEDFEALPGIGPVLAEEIIAYRQRVGGFKSLEELKNVNGIGERKLLKIKDLIVID